MAQTLVEPPVIEAGNNEKKATPNSRKIVYAGAGVVALLALYYFYKKSKSSGSSNAAVSYPSSSGSSGNGSTYYNGLMTALQASQDATATNINQSTATTASNISNSTATTAGNISNAQQAIDSAIAGAKGSYNNSTYGAPPVSTSNYRQAISQTTGQPIAGFYTNNGASYYKTGSGSYAPTQITNPAAAGFNPYQQLTKAQAATAYNNSYESLVNAGYTPSKAASLAAAASSNVA